MVVVLQEVAEEMVLATLVQTIVRAGLEKA